MSGISREDVEEFLESLDGEGVEIEKKIRRFVTEMAVGADTDEIGQIKYVWKHADDSLSMKEEAKMEYEEWQAKAEELVDEYRPKRSDIFQNHYATIQKTLRLGGGSTTSQSQQAILDDACNALTSQRAIIRGIRGKIEVEELKARRQISARLAKNEIERSRELFSEGFVRSAGVVASVAVERELLTQCEESDEVEEYNPTHGISRLSQTLYEEEIIDKTKWNDLKAMAAIRETCAHAETPEEHRVQRLISDADEFVRS